MNPQENKEDIEFYSYELKIPKERVGALIGKKGRTKKELQDDSGVKIHVNSKEGFVRITSKDPIMLLNMKHVVEAIGYGFNPEIARLLLRPDYNLEVINIKDYAKNKNSEIRLKGRVIGKKGKAREVIERLTETYISVYDKTISIVGEINSTYKARRAIENLLRGSQHSRVFSMLEKERRKEKLRKVLEDFDIVGKDI